MEERYKATMVLHAVGDTIGFKNGDWEFNYNIENFTFAYTNELLYEFISLGGINHLDTKDWIVSDDTVLHMATAKSFLIEHKDIEKLGEILKDEYIASFKNMKNRFPGFTTDKYITELKSGMKWDEVPYDENSGGSGAAMRNSCIGLIYYGKDNRDKLIKYALEASRITHNCAVGYLGGITSALFTAFALENIKIEKWITELLKILNSNKIDNYIKETRGFDEYERDKHTFISKWTQLKDDLFENGNLKKQNKIMTNLISRGNHFYLNYKDEQYKTKYIGGSGDDSVIIAYCALLDSQNNWEKLVIYSMLHVGDTDTTGCIAASWYGAMYGFEDISTHFINNLEYSKELNLLGSKLYKKFHK